VAGRGPQRHREGGPRNHRPAGLPAEVWTKVEREVAANPDATQHELARKIGVSRATVGRVVRARRAAAAAAE
jgi:predicted DNA-binding protein (UPF0251 family)